MKPKANDKKVSPSSPNLPQIVGKILIVYLISAVIVLVICFIFGWRSIENIGTGFIYGSLGLALFGALLLAGNTVPAQLSKLSLPSVRRHQENESDGSPSKDEVKRFFFTTLICGAFLFVTGLILKLL
jgi:predicted secreted protein